MKHNFKLLILISVALSLSACESLKKKEGSSVSNEITQIVDGATITGVVTSADFKEIIISNKSEDSRAVCFRNNNSSDLNSHAQIVREMAIFMGKGVDCGAGYHDVAVAEQDRKARQTEARFGSLDNAVNKITGNGLIGYGIGKAADVADSMFKNAGGNTTTNTTNVDNGSSYQGAQGENASYTETGSTFDGVESVDIDNGDDPDLVGEEDPIEVTDEASCLLAGGTPVFVDGEYDRCSDGEGGDL